MGLDSIINFILDVIEGGPIPKKKGAAAAAAAGTTADAGAPGPPLHPVMVEWNEMQAFCDRCDAEFLPFNGVKAEEPETYWAKRFQIEDAVMSGKLPFEAVLAAGFLDESNWEKVSKYVTIKWSEVVKGPNGEPTIKEKDELLNAAARVRLAQQREAAAAAPVNKTPEYLEPIEGVTVEQWAAASAALVRLPPTASEADRHAVLGNLEIDPRAFEMAQPQWQARMSKDTTGTVATRYGDAFSGKATAPKKEPCTLEQFVEILAAQEVWGERGKDIAAELQKTFEITVAVWGQYAEHWSPKIGADVKTSKRFGELHPKFKDKYEKMA